MQLNTRVWPTSVLLQSDWLRDSPTNHDDQHWSQHNNSIRLDSSSDDVLRIQPLSVEGSSDESIL